MWKNIHIHKKRTQLASHRVHPHCHGWLVAWDSYERVLIRPSTLWLLPFTLLYLLLYKPVSTNPIRYVIADDTTMVVVCLLRGGVGLEYGLVSLGLHCFLRLERALCWRSGRCLAGVAFSV